MFCLMCAAAASLAVAGAQAQALSDPTRPATGAAAAAGMPEDIPGVRRLQSVLLSGGRKLAIIDGVTVPLGGKLGEARVVKITESEVTLKNGEETEILKLFPTIEKQPVKRTAGAAAASVSNRQGGTR